MKDDTCFYAHPVLGFGEPSPPETASHSSNSGDESINQFKSEWTEEDENILLEPFRYLAQKSGKNIRGKMMDAFNVWLRVPETSLDEIKKAVDMLHNASLLIDDIQDSSTLRRGVPVAHAIYGTPKTINTANYVYFESLNTLATLSNPALLVIFTEELMNLHRGQGMDIHWRDTQRCPSKEDYLQMISNKTGGLFRLAIKLMQAESPSNIDCVPIATTMGLLFQISDDLLNLSSTTYTEKKGFCEDLTEGKFSFPVIHAIHADSSNSILQEILKQRTNNLEVKKYALTYMEEKGSFAYTKEVIENLNAELLSMITTIEKQVGDQGVAGGDAIRHILQLMSQM